MKKVLIISYYWPPAGGAGVQRWLKFVKYLHHFDWEPIVYTPQNGEIPVFDPSLEKDIPLNLQVIKTPIWEPYTFYKQLVGQKPHEKINTGFLTERKKPKTTEKLAVWIRGNLFIPDARKFWIQPSVKFLKKYLHEHPVDSIISTGPPHSMHLIALQLKEQLQIPWLADFRDPWTNIDYYADLMLTHWADKKHHQLEQQVLTAADRIVTVSPTLTNELHALSNQPLSSSKFVTITNGYDEEADSDLTIQRDQKFSIVHIGTLVRSRNPEVLWKVLSELIEQNPLFAQAIEIKLVGKVDIQVSQSIAHYGLSPYLTKVEYLPHDNVIAMQRQSQVLLLIINDTKNAKGILTGKLFEYLRSRRPILGIGPVDGDAATILNETHAGKMLDFQDSQGIKAQVINYFNKYQTQHLVESSSQINSYSRRELTHKLANVLDQMIKTH